MPTKKIERQTSTLSIIADILIEVGTSPAGWLLNIRFAPNARLDVSSGVGRRLGLSLGGLNGVVGLHNNLFRVGAGGRARGGGLVELIFKAVRLRSRL